MQVGRKTATDVGDVGTERGVEFHLVEVGDEGLGRRDRSEAVLTGELLGRRGGLDWGRKGWRRLTERDRYGACLLSLPGWVRSNPTLSNSQTGRICDQNCNPSL